LKFTDKSIDKACEKILSHFGFFDKSDTKIFAIDSDGNEIEFETNKLCIMQETENVCLDVINNIESTLSRFNVLNLDFTKIENLLKNNTKFKEVIKMFDSNFYDLRNLKEYKLFLSGFNSHLFSIKQEYYSKLRELQKKIY
jgi:hypothetical protein